jgi:capsular exopolysaccharide synthesis family protein
LAESEPRNPRPAGSWLEQGEPYGRSFDQIAEILWRRRRSIGLTFLISMAIIAAITFALPKVYSTRALVLVSSQGEAGSSFEASQDSQILGKTYAELIQTPAVLDQVVAELPFAFSRDELLDATSVTAITGSQLLELKADGDSPEQAAKIANIYADVFVSSSEEPADVGTARLTVAAKAVEPSSAAKPQPKLYLLVGAFLAALLAAAVGWMRERRSEGVEVDESTTMLFGIPVVGRIPKLRGLSGGSWTALNGGGADLEAFRLLHANLAFLLAADEPFSLAVVSGQPDEGKTVCAKQLAIAATEFGQSALVVDADLRQASLSSQFPEAEESNSGLGAVLAGDESASVKTVPIPGTDVRVMPAGPPSETPAALLASGALAGFNRRAKERFEFVVYDTPPLMIAADASLVAAQCDGVILVVDVESGHRSHVVRAIDQLRRSGGKILGVVLNRVSEAPMSDSYYGRSRREKVRRP